MHSEKKKDCPYHLNPHLFIYIREGEFIVWDYLNHQQWVVGGDYINALERVSKKQSISVNIFNDLAQSGIITRKAPRDFEWGWDVVSKIYHLSTPNIFEDVLKSKEDFVEEYRATCEALSKVEPTHLICDYAFENQFDPRLENISLGQAFRERKTTRNFDGSPVTYRQLGSLLYAGCGEIHTTWNDLESVGYTPVGDMQ